MAIEKRWPAVPPVAFTASGTDRGKVTLSSTKGFKVKQEVVLVHPTLPRLDLEVKRVTRSYLLLGPKGKIDDYADLSVYDTQSSLYAYEQKKNLPSNQEMEQATYDQEPTVAKRVVQVDEFGDYFSTDNPLPVQLSDGNINIDTLNAELQVQLSAQDSPGKTHDSVRIGDGVDEMAINDDGSINVNIIESTSVATPGLSINYQETSAIASGVETTIISLIAPTDGLRVSKIQVSGENLAEYRVKVDGSTISLKRSWWTAFNQEFAFEDFRRGLLIPAGSVLTVTVLHNRPMPGNFEATVYAE